MNSSENKAFAEKIMLYLAIFVFFSCTQEKKVNLLFADSPVIAEALITHGDTLIVCDISAVKDTFTVYLDEFWNDCEIVLLDNEHPEALVMVDGHSTSSDNYLGVYSFRGGGYKLFNRKGEYIATLSSRGSAPNEYLISIYDSFIDEAANRVFLLPMMAKYILVYDLQGNEKGLIPLAYDVPKGRIKPDASAKEVSIAILPFENNPSVFWVQNFEGNIIHEVQSGHLKMIPSDYSNEVDAGLNVSEFDFSLFSWATEADTLYHYDRINNKLKPALTLEFKNDEFVQHDYIELPDHFIVRLYTKDSSNPMRASGTSAIMIDKKTLRGAYVHFKLKSLGGMEIPLDNLNFRRGFYWANFYSFDMEQMLNKVLTVNNSIEAEVKDEILRLIDYATDDSNNIVLVGKMQSEPDGKSNNISINDSYRTAGTKNREANDDADNKLYTFKDLGEFKEVPFLIGGNQYFRENNLYGDWDVNDEKEVRVSYTVEKDGTASDVVIIKSSGIEKLDREAVRLIKNARHTIGLHIKGKPIRCGGMENVVFFPPKK